MVKGKKKGSVIDLKIKEKSGIPGVGKYNPDQSFEFASRSISCPRKGRFG